MRKNYFSKKVLQACVLFFMIITANVFAQVGIGTITPNASSILDISSTTQGMLAPRMTTAQRTAIASPADGLMVYDTDLKSFYHYNLGITSWNQITSASTGRSKFKLIKSTDVLATVLAAEKTAGSNTKYVLDPNTYYEINGTVTFDLPIELNGAYISGEDSADDKIVRTSGNLFDGATGGSIRNVTIQVTGGGKVFNLSGTAAQTLIFRDALVLGCSNVGSISGFGLVFVSIVQYAGNTTGIVYDNITRVLISNAGWFGNNLGTFEKFTGTFSLIEKQGGFSEVNLAAIGVDVSDPSLTITGDAVMETVVFTGTLSTGKYVNGYTTGTYPGYNFNNSWNVRCAGIPTETDASAVGEFSVDYAVGFGAQTTFNNSNPSNTIKVQGVSTSNNLYRFSRGGTDNRLQYLGKKKRFFQVTGSISFQANAGIFIIYVALNGTPVSKYKIYGRSNVTGDIVVLPLNALIEMNTNDYVEIYAQRFTAVLPENIITPNMTLVIK